MNRRKLLVLAASLPIVGRTVISQSMAQGGFPTRTVRIVVPFSAGGSTDILSRLCAQILTDKLGQTTVAENITGAGGTIGAQRVLDAPADGYTLMAGTPGPITINPHLLPNLPYAPLRDFTPVAFVGDSPAVVVVRKDSPLRSVADLVARAKAEPGRLTYASAGIGSFAHLSGELFKVRAGVDLTHVPYRGTAPAATDIIGGRVDVMFENYPSVQGQLESDQFRTLAIGAARRSALLPGVPTVAEAGVSGYESTSWFGLFARSATPPQAIATLNAAINAGLTESAVATRLASLGIEPAGGTPEAFRAYIARRLEETGELIRNANIRVD
ncbi:MAG TPA: tripartite tricarboxylate transporter substrate binding protein [Falsiroseomonas sp.]|jgi:tripartite-type tricarboxylate transporter receptor subunit TctC|nr:tripartite tricarboxylate transporter substrate binding protein [Falsiroseomonas sp.]